MNYTKNVQYYRYIVTCISEMYDISSITYNVQITGMLLISMPMKWTVRKY